MISWLPPAFIFFAGAILVGMARGRVRQAVLVIVPLVAFYNMLQMPPGSAYSIEFLDHTLVLGHVDKLSMVFGYIFVIMGLAGGIFSLHVEDTGQHVAAFTYVGSSLGVIFAGDYLTLFLFWEIMAIASTFLIWTRRTEASRSAGLRYVVVHIVGGMFLLCGIVMHVVETGSLEFGYLGLHGFSSWLILLGFALNAAIPPLSAWLSDSYPEATVTGAVYLSAFTSKTAVYVLARSFPGAEILVWAGVLMSIYGIVYAILENDMRRVLAYSIINQVGFMVAGIGIGTELSLNGSASHAFAHILYKALLMMSAGAVLYMTGKSKCTELGGLYRTMPLTLIFCLVGAASISAFPLTGGFISKSMIIAAAGEGHLTVVWYLLTLASAGVFLHAGIKFPWFVFFAKDSGLRPKEAPLNMLVAMGFLAFLCIFIGIYPSVLYRILPYEADFVPYTAGHVVSQLQLLLFSALAFFVLLKYLQRTNTISLDTDWLYRKGAQAFVWVLDVPGAALGAFLGKRLVGGISDYMIWFGKNPMLALRMSGQYAAAVFAGPEYRRELRKKVEAELEAYPGNVTRHWAMGTAVLWVTLILLAYLVLYYR